MALPVFIGDIDLFDVPADPSLLLLKLVSVVLSTFVEFIGAGIDAAAI
jgi:hypothetical protein